MDAFEIAHSITVEAIRAGVNRPDEITRLFEAIAAQARGNGSPIAPPLAEEPIVEPEAEREPEAEHVEEPEAEVAPLPSVAWHEPPQPPAKLTEAQIADSYDDEHINCLECGRRLQRLKHHLNKNHQLTPDAYRERWGLPKDYPMVTRQQSDQFRKLAMGRIEAGEFGPNKVQEAREKKAATS